MLFKISSVNLWKIALTTATSPGLMKSSLHLLPLCIDFLIQHRVPGGEHLHGTIVFVKLRGCQFHLEAEDFEGLVDLRHTSLCEKPLHFHRKNVIINMLISLQVISPLSDS